MLKLLTKIKIRQNRLTRRLMILMSNLLRLSHTIKNFKTKLMTLWLREKSNLKSHKIIQMSFQTTPKLQIKLERCPLEFWESLNLLNLLHSWFKIPLHPLHSCWVFRNQKNGQLTKRWWLIPQVFCNPLSITMSTQLPRKLSKRSKYILTKRISILIKLKMLVKHAFIFASGFWP